MVLTIPRAAMPVIEILRRDVPRPERLPVLSGGVLRWQFISQVTGSRFRCPMGLHPDALDPEPDNQFGFPACPSWIAITAFWEWWDNQSDARAAVDAIWPIKKKKVAK